MKFKFFKENEKLFSKKCPNGNISNIATITPGPSGSVDNSDSENGKFMSSNNLQKKSCKKHAQCVFVPRSHIFLNRY